MKNAHMDKNVSDQRTTRRLYLLASTAAFIISVMYVRMSQAVGRLCQDLMYDDIGYVNDATSRLAIGYKQGIIDFLLSFVTNPPHSPFSTLLACTALAIGGYHDSVVYIANSVLLIAAALFLVRCFKDSGLEAVSWIVITFLSSPLAYRAIHDFRPDIALGCMTVVMVYFFATALFHDNSRQFRIAGIALGACLLIKPTFFVHSYALAVMLAVLHSALGTINVSFLANRLSVPRRIESVYFLLTGFLVALPYFAVNAQHIFNYFWNNTRGATAAIWSYSSSVSLLSVSKEFLLGSATIVAYRLAGFHIVIALICILCGCALMVRRRSIRELLTTLTLVLSALGSFAIIIVGRHKNDFFLASFYALLFFAGFYSFAYLAEQMGQRSRRVLFVGAWLLLFAASYKNRSLIHWVPLAEASRSGSWNTKVVSAIAENMAQHQFTPTETATLFVSTAGPVNAETMKWIATKQGINLQAYDHHTSGDINAFITAARDAHYILVPNGNDAEYYHWLPSTAIQAPFLAFLRSEPRFQQIQFFAANDHYYLFVNRDKSAPVIDVEGISLLKGFNPTEGPYPQWNLPRVRWMDGPEAKLCFTIETPGWHTATMRYKPDGNGILRITNQDGRLLKEHAYTINVFSETDFVFSAPAGQQCFSLSTGMNTAPTPKRPLLFTKIAVKKLP